jgi:formylmethanofuran dehydrogenase subunit E
MRGTKKKKMIKKNNNNYYDKVQCDECGNFFPELEIDHEDGRRLCRECEQNEWNDDDN